MGKRTGYFVIVVLVLVPVLAVGLTLGGMFQMGQKVNLYAQEVFSGQSTKGNCVLLADKGGNAIFACLLEDNSTHLISILPSANPKEEKSVTFLSVYQKDGIEGLKQQVENSLSCTVIGYLEVDFSGIASVVDALGGIEMKGKNHTGQEVQSYLNSLPTSSAGAQAQQEVVLAVGRRFCNAGFWKAQKGLGKLLRITETDLSVSALMKIGKKLIPALDGNGLFQYCLPHQGKWDLPCSAGNQ